MLTSARRLAIKFAPELVDSSLRRLLLLLCSWGGWQVHDCPLFRIPSRLLEAIDIGGSSTARLGLHVVVFRRFRGLRVLQLMDVGQHGAWGSIRLGFLL